MKLNIIHHNTHNFLNSHTNISPFNLEHPEILSGDITDIDWIVDNGEAEQIIALDTIEYIPYNKICTVLSNWIGKLCVGGQLILGFIETAELVRWYYRGNIDLEGFNQLSHGNQKESQLVKLSSFSALDLIERLTQEHTIKLKKHTMINLDVTLTFERYK